MPRKHYIVILLDVNSIPRESPLIEDDEEGRRNNVLPAYEGGEEEEVDGNASTVVDTPSKSSKSRLPYKYQAVKAVKENVISILCKEALQYNVEKFDFSTVYWSYKFYNSSVEIKSKTVKGFQPLGIESIEEFEKQLDSYIDVGSQSARKSDPRVNLVHHLSTSLKDVLCDLSWPQPRTGFEVEGIPGTENCNAIHALFRVPGTEDEVKDFVPNWSPASGSKTIMNDLLPKAFAKKMKDQEIRLMFTDLWPIFNDNFNNDEHSWDMGECSKPLLRIVHYLRGSISPAVNISVGVPVGLPSYADLLKLLLESATRSYPSGVENVKPVNNDTRKTLHMLHGSLNGSMDDDVESNRSNNAFKILNPSYALSKNLNMRRSFPEMTDGKNKWALVPTTSNDRRRFSDESNNHRGPLPVRPEEYPRKRKFDFEEDMASEEGYTPKDIENWCNLGKVNVKETPQPSMTRSKAAVKKRTPPFNPKYAYQSTKEEYVSPQVLPPQKRARRDAAVGILSSGRSRSRHNLHEMRGNRFSDSRSSYENRQSHHQEVAVRSRGQLMVTKGLQPKQRKPSTLAACSSKGNPCFGLPDTKGDYWYENESATKTMKKELHLMLQEVRSIRSGSDPKEVIEAAGRAVQLFMDMAVDNPRAPLPVAAQVIVTTLAGTLSLDMNPIREIMESILFISIPDLNLEVIRKLDSGVGKIQRKCELQIFLQFEMNWTVPSNDPNCEERFVEEVGKLLTLMRIYLKNVNEQKFVEDFLVPLYPSQKKHIRELAKSLNFHDCSLLDSSLDSNESLSSAGRDDQSVSSFNSSMCGPDDSTSQHANDNSHSNYMNNSQNSMRTSLRTASFLAVNNPKRTLVLPMTKQHARTKSHLKPQSQITHAASLRPNAKSPKPKKVRRNLFDVQSGRDAKDMKMLLNLATTNSPSFSRSPSTYKSPMSRLTCSPRSPHHSSLYAAARAIVAKAKGHSSRRRLALDADGVEGYEETERQLSGGQWGTLGVSPEGNLICPESPYNPAAKSGVKKNTSAGGSASTGKSVVRESPEVPKALSQSVSESAPSTSTQKHGAKGNLRRMDSFSFYSCGQSAKSQAWEKVGCKLMAAKLKDSVDFSGPLSLNDLEFLGSNSSNEENSTNVDIANALRTNENDVKPNINGASPNEAPVQEFNDKPNNALDGNMRDTLIALLRRGDFSSTVRSILAEADAHESGTRSPFCDTPTKRVQFTRQLVSTPSRTSSGGGPVTPKSILKESGSSHT